MRILPIILLIVLFSGFTPSYGYDISLVGDWVRSDDYGEYHGLYVYTLQEDGTIVFTDYPEKWPDKKEKQIKYGTWKISDGKLEWFDLQASLLTSYQLDKHRDFVEIDGSYYIPVKLERIKLENGKFELTNSPKSSRPIHKETGKKQIKKSSRKRGSWLGNLIYGIIRLLIMISIGCFVGTIFECRNWMKTASFLAKPLIRLGRLPDICGTAFLTAFVSNPAANSMIAGAYSDKKITRRDMILNGIANAYAAKVSHSMRMSFVIVSAFGAAWLAGIAYFAVQFFNGFLRTIIILFTGRIKHKEEVSKISSPKMEILPWYDAFKKAVKRTKRMLIRILLITIPIYLIFSCLGQMGFFHISKNYIPEGLAGILTPEMMAVMVARLGGMVSSAAIAGEFFQNGEISIIQIVIAFLLGNMITNPIRTFRRNLPIAMGIFPGRDGLWIVLTLQTFRFIMTGVVIALLMIFTK